MTPTSGSSFERIRAALITVSGEPVSTGAWTTFLCPTHDDTTASAAIKYDPEHGRTVVRCFAGCADDELLDSLGLSISDLFDGPQTEPAARPRARAVRPALRRERRGLGKQIGWPAEVAQYVYRDVDGMRVGRVIRIRTEHERGVSKGFYLRHYEPSTDLWPLGAFPPVLYRLPQVAAAVVAGQAIWLCEGEKDADRAADLGLAATCNALGAGSFTPAHAQQLAGARRVVVVADRDPAGYAHARTIRTLVAPLVRELVVIQARDGKDLSDHCDAGHGLEDFDPATELGYSDADIADLLELSSDQDVDPQLGPLLACVTPLNLGATRAATVTPAWPARLAGHAPAIADEGADL